MTIVRQFRRKPDKTRSRKQLIRALSSTVDLVGVDALATKHHHSFITYRILKKIHGLEDIAPWASNHHDKLDVSGYPLHRTAEALTIELRIIMIADTFQALTQNRPYRIPHPPEVIVDILKQDIARNQLDAELVDLVESKILACCAIATTPSVQQPAG